ncbi:aromatic ring-hydroxylating dioxygenase subunit alpha [Amycolatopsis sp. ATCC 39116]|uniref:aromatic ring-hydroxylating dioxygenase subunit alpha n=1 Tax=Amycolatopsis sp. (strain ATCC 39116 / 75iv2) TaxID=385957 RepID=UPI000585456B|nr:aromatic ring-hydroxylating dioxygenase subunit alpha [Amycolatopsis sp. ATCC 39116]
MTLDNCDLVNLVDWENGLISPLIFSDQEIYDVEMERLFGRTWLFLAHESMLKRPGDFFSTYMGADPVLVVRQRDGSVKAFLNSCRHRGMKVCRADGGNVRAFTCTYHGWTYNTAGELVNVPVLDGGYRGGLDKEKWGLIPVAQVDSYKGLIFGCFDPTAPSLREYLGDAKFYLDNFLDRREGGTEVLDGVHKWSFAGNWKLAAEQFAGDGYHVASSHVSIMMTFMDPNAPRQLDLSEALTLGKQYSSRHGHGAGFHVETPGYGFYPTPSLLKYYEETQSESEARLGHPRLGFHNTVFPNLSGLTGQFMTIRVWHPKGPNAFETWSWVLVDRDAPSEVRDEQRRFTTSQFSPAGMTESDDGENWSEIGRNLSASPQIKRHLLNYQMGLGQDRDDHPEYPGTITDYGVGDAPQRAFYRRWLEFMTSDRWPVALARSGDQQAPGSSLSA